MPLYDLKCSACGDLLQDVFGKIDQPMPRCECGGVREVYHSAKPPVVHVFDSEAVFEHITGERKTFSSKRELKKFCRDNGKYSLYAEGS